MIVPYDRSGIERLWGGSPGGALQQPLSGVATAFLHKTFQVKTEIPPVLLSEWRDYFLSLLMEALPDHEPSGFHNLYRVLVLCGQQPTPRDLKRLVNEIGFIHRQWGDHIPLADICYYVLCSRRFPSVSEALREASIPEEAVLRLLGDQLKDSLAQLAFNVDLVLARQFLLAEPLKACFLELDSEGLGRFAAQHAKGFWEVLENVLTELLEPPVDASLLGAIALTLEDSGLLRSDFQRAT
jgi:hypothetical protein